MQAIYINDNLTRPCEQYNSLQMDSIKRASEDSKRRVKAERIVSCPSSDDENWLVCTGKKSYLAMSKMHVDSEFEKENREQTVKIMVKVKQSEEDTTAVMALMALELCQEFTWQVRKRRRFFKRKGKRMVEFGEKPTFVNKEIGRGIIKKKQNCAHRWTFNDKTDKVSVPYRKRTSIVITDPWITRTESHTHCIEVDDGKINGTPQLEWPHCRSTVNARCVEEEHLGKIEHLPSYYLGWRPFKQSAQDRCPWKIGTRVQDRRAWMRHAPKIFHNSGMSLAAHWFVFKTNETVYSSWKAIIIKLINRTQISYAWVTEFRHDGDLWI